MSKEHLVSTYPVHYIVDRPARFMRIQVVTRILAAVVLGVLGTSMGALFLVAYLALPVYAASRLAGRGGVSYLLEDGPRVARGLRWFCAVAAWFGLVSDTLPGASPDEDVHITIVPVGQPTAASALWRLVMGLPSALALALVAVVGALVWLWSALRVLLDEQVGASEHAFLTGLQRWGARLLAYQASLVDVYPPFSFDEGPTTISPITHTRQTTEA